jgi:hypothetical protein
LSEQKYESAPVNDEAYFNSGKLTVSLPGRHVLPEVYAAAERFTRACAASRKAEAEITTAGNAVRDTANRVMREAYLAVHEDAEIDEDVKLAQSDDWVAARAAEETARTRFAGGREAVAHFHAEVVAAAASPEWKAYLREQREELSARITEDLSRAIETLRELEEVEGLNALVEAGGVYRKRRGTAVAPVESVEVQRIQEARERLIALTYTEATRNAYRIPTEMGAR